MKNKGLTLNLYGRHALLEMAVSYLELSCSKKLQKKSQPTGLGNRGRLKVLNGTKLTLND